MTTTDIILVLYGDRKDLDLCVTSVKATCKDYELHIVDNNTENRGFTRACNEGIKTGSAPYIWLLNQDATVLPGCQEALIKRLESHPKVGIAGSMQIDPQDPDLVRHGGTLCCFPAGQHKGGRLSMGHCQIPSKEKWVNGASMMFKRGMYNVIGPMDEKMFLLYSESDYAYVARKNGYEVWYEPDSRVVHRLGKASKNSQGLAQKDMVEFMKKWGITTDGKGTFFYSREFALLDALP